MAARQSAGIVLFRRTPDLLVLLGHMGGPFYAAKDDGAWSIPKGEYTDDEDPLAAARREFEEELGSAPPADGYLELGTITQRSGKRVIAWAVEGDFDVATQHSNTFELVWPPRSGRVQRFPEVDRAEWFSVGVGARKLVSGQAGLLDRLAERL